MKWVMVIGRVHLSKSVQVLIGPMTGESFGIFREGGRGRGEGRLAPCFSVGLVRYYHTGSICTLVCLEILDVSDEEPTRDLF